MDWSRAPCFLKRQADTGLAVSTAMKVQKSVPEPPGTFRMQQVRTSNQHRWVPTARALWASSLLCSTPLGELACTGEKLLLEGKSDLAPSAMGGVGSAQPSDGVGGTGSSTAAASSVGGAPGAQGGAVNCDAEQYWDQVAATCRPWRNCSPGEFVAREGSRTGDRVCQSCFDDAFSSASNAGSCSACRACGSLAIASTCSATHDTSCAQLGVVLQFGSADVDGASAVAVDGMGNVWVAGSMGEITGETDSQSRRGFARKYSADGSLVAEDEQTTPFDDRALAIAVDGSGNAWVAGYTAGDLAAPISGDYDAFVRKYSNTGSTELTNQFGSSKSDEATAIAVDRAGNVWVAGDTNGNLIGSSHGNYDPFVRMYPVDGSAPVDRQFGGSSSDLATAIAVDGSGNAWVTGSVAQVGGFDIFVRKVPVDDSTPLIDNFGSSASRDVSTGIAIDAVGNVWVVGRTQGDLAGSSLGGEDAFVRKYPADGSAPVTEQFGTKGHDEAYAVAVDGSSNVWVVGSTGCNISGTNLDRPLATTVDDFGTVLPAGEICSPAQPSLGNSDAFVREYRTDGSPPRTYQFGSSKFDSAYAVAVALDGSVWIAGITSGTIGDQAFGESDAFLVRFTPEP